MSQSSPFLDHVLTQFLVKIHDRPGDNYDAMRFSFDGVDRSAQFDVTQHKNCLYFLLENFEALYDAYLLLADEASRKIFMDLILFRLAGHLHVKLDANNAAHWQSRQRADNLPSRPSSIEYTGLLGPLKHFEGVEFEGNLLNLDCWNASIAYSFFIKQYYLDRNGTTIRPEPNDHVIDAGACFGDTALGFASSVRPGGRVYAFEVLENHLDVIRHNNAQNPELGSRIRVFPFGLGDTCNAGAAPIDSKDALAPGFSLRGIDQQAAVPVQTIDALVESGQIERVDFVKMDIEGYELKALRGAEATIRRFRPKLAISIYHKLVDLFEIPQFIHGLDLGYKLYVEHYTIHAEETILYASV